MEPMRDVSNPPARTWIPLLALGLALGPAGEAAASGYAIKEQSARLLGSAFAGAGSSAQDPTVLFFNPAGVARLDGLRAVGVFSIIFPRTEFDNDNSELE